MILALIPTKKNMGAALRKVSEAESDRISQENPDLIEVVRDSRGGGDANLSGLVFRGKHIAGIRQEILEAHLKDHHTHVLWIDADVIRYSSETIRSLYQTSLDFKAIVAPKVLLDKLQDRFYDIAGFVEKGGKWTSSTKPHFTSQGRYIELDSVGCFYLVPADVFRQGAKYDYDLHYTEHMSICQFARKAGYKVICDTSLEVYHAYLPDFGENFH